MAWNEDLKNNEEVLFYFVDFMEERISENQRDFYHSSWSKNIVVFKIKEIVSFKIFQVPKYFYFVLFHLVVFKVVCDVIP